jgi:hypothetical protein
VSFPLLIVHMSVIIGVALIGSKICPRKVVVDHDKWDWMQ